MTNNDILKKAMIEALEKSLGIVTDACKAVGISRETHYRWMREDEQYKKDVEGIENASLDFAESKLFERINEGSDTAIIFYLKTKGKKRGYVERQEITGADSGPLEIKVNVLGNDNPILEETDE